MHAQLAIDMLQVGLDGVPSLVHKEPDVALGFCQRLLKGVQRVVPFGGL